jgi:hypothetical protein
MYLKKSWCQPDSDLHEPLLMAGVSFKVQTYFNFAYDTKSFLEKLYLPNIFTS